MDGRLHREDQPLDRRRYGLRQPHTKMPSCGEGGLMITKTMAIGVTKTSAATEQPGGDICWETARYTDLQLCTALSRPQATLCWRSTMSSQITRLVTEQYWEICPLEGESPCVCRFHSPSGQQPPNYLRFKELPALQFSHRPGGHESTAKCLIPLRLPMEKQQDTLREDCEC